MDKAQLIAVGISIGFFVLIFVWDIRNDFKGPTGLPHISWGDYPPMPKVKPPKAGEDDPLLEQVLKELDFAVGELQRAKVTIGILSKEAEGDEAILFARVLDCMDNRIKSAKATMMLAGYTPIAYRDNENPESSIEKPE